MATNKNEKNTAICTVFTSESLLLQKKDQQTKFWKINKEMLRFKMFYFFQFGANGVCMPFLTVFAKENIGISPSPLAAILTAQICFLIISKPTVGYLADYFNKLKAIICMLAGIATVSFFLLLAVPKIRNGAQAFTFDYVVASKNSCGTLFTSEINDVNEFCENCIHNTADVLHFNHVNRKVDWCFQSTANILTYLDRCPGSNHTKSRNDLENAIGLDQKYAYSENNSTLLTDSVLCESCCKLSEECLSIYCQIRQKSTVTEPIEEVNTNDFQTYQFWLYTLFSIIGVSGVISFTSLADTACCETAQKTGSQFGRQRLWGAVGCGLLSPVSGFLIDLTDGFLASWILMAILSLISLLIIKGIKLEMSQLSKNILKDVGTVLASAEVFAFNFSVLMNGVGMGIMSFYVVLFLTSIGGSKFLCGLISFVQCFSGEIPFMFFSEWAIKKLGHFNLLTLSLMAYCFRFLWYSWLNNPWLILPAEVLHGFTFGLFYPAVASFAILNAKPGTEATFQAVLFTSHDGIGVGIGCVLAGIGIDTVGGHATFLYLSILSGIAMILNIVFSLHFRQQKGSINATSSTCK